ncbi:AAA family ATPase [Rahnella sp. PD12R]|uniref:AAA family ATPase n=1 Tax=Rahnella sp. PD12R TaxID=2855688 RepID=UPI001C48502A|nr:AAA family ATPase [Rahnella sp. PD12R]MBV6818393.1 AAA family ATPase [Rahnella sp. PD12R]
MKLNRITIENFRCFRKLEVSFHPSLTVLVATNGAGKTTVLDAARIALWPYIKGYDLGSTNGKSATIQIDDVRLKKRPGEIAMEAVIPAKVTAEGMWGEQYENEIWSQSREQVKASSKTLSGKTTKKFTAWGEELQSRVRDEDRKTSVDLPLVLYLGTGRLWYQGRYISEGVDKQLDISSFSRMWGYQNCLTATSSYKQFEAWYSWIYRSYRELQIKQLENENTLITDNAIFESFKAAIHVVKQAINSLTKATTGWHDLEYRSSQNEQLVMNHNDHGSIPLSQLSDGLRNMVAMISDIAFRCIKLNPHFGGDAALKTRGVVLIDEVDMFLHPAWQQHVIHSLREAFPAIQFIVTTHSPQVLSTVPDECIRILDNGEVFNAPKGSQGAESSRILKRIFDVEPRPKHDPVAVLLKEYLDLVYSDKWESLEAEEKRKVLNQHFGDEEPSLTDADLYIENRKWEQGLEEDN